MAIAAAIIGAVVGAGLGAALAPNPPGAPDLVAGNREGVLAEAETLAARRKIEKAAQLGGVVDYETGRTTTVNDQPMVTLPGVLGQRGPVPYDPADFQTGGKYAWMSGIGFDPTKHLTYGGSRQVPETKRADFTGLGEADVQTAQADTVAREMLKLQRELGPAFIEQRNKELAIADPEGVAARRKLSELIQADAQAATQAKRPLADEMQRQMLDEAMAGDQLTGEQDNRLQQALLSSAMTRGDAANVGGVRGSITEDGRQGRINDRMAAGMSWMTGGATPEDVAFRRNQQVMANLGAFVNGQTPVTQFGQLSGAQSGAAPFRGGAPLATANPNAGQAGQQFAMQNYGNELQNVLNTPNPWLTALSLGVKGAQAYTQSK